MNKELAQRLINELLVCHKAIDSVEIVSQEIDDENLRQEFRNVLARISFDIYSEAMGKIILKFPNLDPFSKENIKSRRMR